MLVSNGVLLHRFEEVAGAVQRLGRHLELDARSLAFRVEEEAEAAAVRIRPAEWLPTVPILDQEDLGSCTGHAGTYALSAALGARDVTLDGAALHRDPETFAVALYEEATREDGFPGEYPPDDTGSSGLGVCRALRAAGFIDRYTWATSLHGLGTALQRGGVMLGMPWLTAFFDADQDGFIDHDPAWLRSGVAGGHEVYLAALECWDTREPHLSVVRFPNSWGSSWGADGWGRMRLSTYLLLRQQIDVKQLHLAS